jgi:hypothetical protein
VWVAPLEYSDAEPDPLRNFAESIVEEMNSKHAEDVRRIYSIYAESDFQVVLNLFSYNSQLCFRANGSTYFVYLEIIIDMAVELPNLLLTPQRKKKAQLTCKSHIRVKKLKRVPRGQHLGVGILTDDQTTVPK